MGKDQQSVAKAEKVARAEPVPPNAANPPIREVTIGCAAVAAALLYVKPL